MRGEINIPAEKLSWAVARAGYSVGEFLEAFPRWSYLFDGTKKPTLKQLEDFAKRVHLPFAYLFLPENPKEELTIPFFRTVTNDHKFDVPLNVLDTISLIQRRQQWAREYLIDNSFEKLAFVGKFSTRDSYSDIVYDIRKTLALSTDWAMGCRNWEDALIALFQKIEGAGVFVTFNSIVENNTHRTIDVDTCRGFVLVDDYAPFMFINSADAKAAQMFTLIHELAHVWVGVSAGFDLSAMLPAENDVERLCDRVAAELLVPSQMFAQLWQENNDFIALSKRFKASPVVILRKALDLGLISRETFFARYNNYTDEVKAKKEATSGGNFYGMQKNRISMRFSGLINQAVKNNALLYRDAYRLTGLKGDTYDKFMTQNF